MTVDLRLGDCLDVLPTIANASVDAVITDPPYPHIKRDYGKWTTEEWWALMVEGVIPEVRRILKPTGSAVFILQPNSEHVGQMRGWLWEFMAWVCREWNMVQDVWWWNTTAMPTVHATRYELMRPSIKACVWAGNSECYRKQESILWDKGEWHSLGKAMSRSRLQYPSGHSYNPKAMWDAHARRNGVTPFNVLMCSNNTGNENRHGHSAGTPLKLADWWTRYICPPGGTVLDPFVGSGTMVLAALQNGCNGIGIDQVPEYIEIAQGRVDEAMAEMVQGELE